MKKYSKPKITVFPDEIIVSGVPGALWGAALMVARAVSAAVKGGIDISSNYDKSKLIQERHINVRRK